MCNRIVISSCSYGGKQTKMMAPNSISRSLEEDKKLRRASPCRALAGRHMICIAEVDCFLRLDSPSLECRPKQRGDEDNENAPLSYSL